MVLNKIDLEPDPEFTIDDARITAVFRLSCATGAGIPELRSALFRLVPEPPRVEPARSRATLPIADFLVYRPQPKARPWSLFRTEDGFRVTGTPPSEEVLERALREAGARKGAEVQLGDDSFEYVP